MRNHDGTEMRDARRRIVYKSQFLSTHPLRTDCKERVGYGGKKFTYVSGDGVIRTMNDIFGHGGWSSKIVMERNILSEKDERGRWHVGYLATVRVTLLNGVSHEDCGSGEGINDNKLKAHEKAIKSAITDAMKRAARHFGERLGNALYVKGNSVRTAPRTNKDALLVLERNDNLSLFGDQAALRNAHLQSQSPDKTLRPTTTKNVATAAVTTHTHHNAAQKENWPQNLAGHTAAASTSLNNRPSRNSVGNAEQHKFASSSSSTGSSIAMPSPIASTAVHRGGASQAQRDNWPQKRVGQVSATTNSFNTRPYPNQVAAAGQQQFTPSSGSSTAIPPPNDSTAVHRGGTSQVQGNQQQFASSSASNTVLPPSNASTTVHRGGPLQAQGVNNYSGTRAGNQHQFKSSSGPTTVLPSPNTSTTVQSGGQSQAHGANTVGTGAGNLSSVLNSNTIVPQRSLMNAPQPPNLMAPPPGRMYNPGGGAQYGGAAVGSVGNHDGKRNLDGVGNRSQLTTGNSNSTGYHMNGDSSKKQKMNPYSNKRNSF